MVPAILLSLVIMAESPDKLTPEAAAQLKEMRASMKEAVGLLEDRKYVVFLDRYLGKELNDEFKGAGREERIKKLMEEEGGLDAFLSACKAARDQPLLKWSVVERNYLFTFEIKISDNKKERILIKGKGQTWLVRL